MSRKPFSSYDHKMNDAKARRLAVEFLEQSGALKLDCPLHQQPEQYGDWDFFITNIDTQKNIYVEVQRKYGWKVSGTWQRSFKTIHVEERKSGSLADLFIMFNFHWDTLLIGNMKKIIKARVITKDCKLSDGSLLKDDRFYELVPESFDFYTLDCGSGLWRTTKP